MPLKRHPALQDLSRDHHLFLVEARHIRWFLADDKRAKSSLEEVIESVIAFWNGAGLAHLKEEEEIIYPAYLERAPLKQRDIDAMLTDHNWMRDKFTELADLPRFENSRPLLRSIGDYIVNHVRHEERVIFEAIQNALSEEQLVLVGQRSLAFRTEHRDPTAIGRAQDHLDLSDFDEV